MVCCGNIEEFFRKFGNSLRLSFARQRQNRLDFYRDNSCLLELCWHKQPIRETNYKFTFKEVKVQQSFKILGTQKLIKCKKCNFGFSLPSKQQRRVNEFIPLKKSQIKLPNQKPKAYFIVTLFLRCLMSLFGFDLNHFLSKFGSRNRKQICLNLASFCACCVTACLI